MSFAGVSLISDGRLWPSAPASVPYDAGTASGYHLLVVEGYSGTKADVLNGKYIQSRSFRVGGYLWFLRCYPNGWASFYEDFISVALILAQDVSKPVKAKYELSFIDQANKQEPSHIRAGRAYDFHAKSITRGDPQFIRRDALENSGHLKGGSFTIGCDLFVMDAASPSQFVSVPPPNMQRQFSDLLVTKQGTDVTFKVGAETFAAHRCVLAARSRVFRAQLFGPMKEGVETANAILVEGMDAQVFRNILVFIYSDSEPELGKEDDEAVMWQHLLAAADRYDLQRLKLMCEGKLCGSIDVNTTTTMLALAERHSCEGLKKACYDFFAAPGNAKTVMATDGFDHLITSSPSIVKELITMLAP